MLHAYCVRLAGEPGPPAELKGVAGARVRLVEEGEVGFWLSDSPGGAATVERVREHDAVVRRALRSATPLPVRYGAAVFEDEAAARGALREGGDRFRAALERLAGRVEMGVRVAWRTPPAGQEPEEDALEVRSGREYLESRRRRLAAESAKRREAEDALDRVAAVFAELELETVRTVTAETVAAGGLAHLVHLRDLERYREAAARAPRAVPDLALTLSGPWAPYSFV